MRRRSVFHLSGGEATAMEGLVERSLWEGIEELRKLALLQYRAGRDVADEAAVQEFRGAALALVRSDTVGLYRHLVGRVEVCQADEPGDVDRLGDHIAD